MMIGLVERGVAMGREVTRLSHPGRGGHPAGQWRPIRKRALSILATFAVFGLAPVSVAHAQTTVRLWDYHVHDKKFRKTIFDKFNRDNPDIKVIYTSQVSGSYQTIIDAAIRSEDPPDIFVTGGIPGGLLKAVELGWLMPLDDVAPSKEQFLQWVNRFPLEERPFVDGVNMVEGKTYSWPSGIQDFAMMLYWNVGLFRDAGLKGAGGGPAAPETLADVRQFARKITEVGQGRVYGIVHGIQRPAIWDQDLFHPATGEGWQLFNWKTGYYDYHHAGFRAHVQMWLDMKKDGSIFPGDMSMDDEQAKFKFAQGLAGMIYGGYWVPGGLLALDTTVEFDTLLSPVEERGKRKGGIPGGGLAGGSEYVVSRGTKCKDAVWRVITFMTSQEYQEAWVKAGGGFSVFEEYNKPEYFPHPTLAKMTQAAAAGRILGPVPSSEAYRAWELQDPIVPGRNDTMQGMWIGKLGWDGWDDLERRSNEALDRALAEAKKMGSKITRADFTFPDWDPSKHYVPKKQ